MIFEPDQQPKGFSLKVNDSILQNLRVRKQQILAVEAFAAIAALDVTPDIFKDQDVIWFVDNESAVSSLIRGAAKPEDRCRLAATSPLAGIPPGLPP